MDTVEETKKDPTTSSANDAADSNGNDEPDSDQGISENAQHGVKNVEAVTQTWSKRSLITAFILMWLLYFVNAMQSSILSNLTPYVTSSFESHSLLTVISVVADAMSAAMYIPISKILDVWGRAEGFLIMTIFATLGLILMATCNDIYTFCAADVFYTIGFGGMTYCVDVITADVSQLKNRGLAYAFTSSPYIITAFAGSKASDSFHLNWRWGFGCFAIIFPIVAFPLFVLLKLNLRKAKKQGIFVREKSNRTVLQSIWHYTVEFDALGVLLFSVGLCVFFIPFDIAGDAPHGWGSNYIIAMIVVGLVVLVFFGLYESFLAPVPMLDWKLLSNRTVIGACALDATYQISYYCWDNYFTSFLQVVNDLTVAEAGYVGNTFDVVSGVLLLLVGWLIRRTGRFKWLLYIAVPLYILAQGLMIYFRKPTHYVGYIVMCQIFISIGGSVFIIVEQLAVLAAVDHQHVASTLALLQVVGTVGDAMGNTISGAIWTNTFEKALERNLPASALPSLEDIYEDLTTQLSYPVGSVTRLAIQKSYAYAQTRMLAAGTGMMVLAFVWVLMIKNIDLHKTPQVKGMVW
ncbi:major facilitator superfamily domain-containing protein [Ilyonectria robusta]|uniref:major facilitator superfamily domain-containing protein n=1 Tax=Ilyonectria robusta TaxID=1079257 RepID=UPI001E8D542D|nr:major facilitator superfamily domain-containing protein [Ilyonectria robusta]KAH8736144.1 major facilitator superfamily domain-containing protein [Ilyonectria robusta]